MAHKTVYGKIQYVKNFADYKVQVVDNFADLHVQVVNNFPNKPGKWQIVNNFPDYKIQIVKNFADFKIKFVKNFPGPKSVAGEAEGVPNVMEGLPFPFPPKNMQETTPEEIKEAEDEVKSKDI